jgi:hypothetical protein
MHSETEKQKMMVYLIMMMVVSLVNAYPTFDEYVFTFQKSYSAD